jgi:anhydro-N-acetylmuramic acid kinase
MVLEEKLIEGLVALSIGLMSGTSMDGIDAALLRTDGSEKVLEELGHTSVRYEPQFKILLKATEYAIRNKTGNMEEARAYFQEAVKDYLKNELKMLELDAAQTIKELSAYLQSTDSPMTLDGVIRQSTKLHADAVKQLLRELKYTPEQVDVVGYHGQTMYHQPSKGISVIVGDGQFLADQVGITVVNDFRRRDVESGGQGAPFAPLYHRALAMRDGKIPVAVVNCGGIANITIIPDDKDTSLIAFDTGPGNGLVDRLVKQRTNGQENMDANGQYGEKGKVDEVALKALHQRAIIKDEQSYFSMQPPKSLDIGDMVFIPELESLSLEDACATLEAFTADTIVRSLDLLNLSEAELPKNWILAGGGWNNPVIRQELEKRLNQKIKGGVKIQTADQVGWSSQALEAQIFSYLAVRSLKNKPLSLPGTTRVPVPMSGGHAYIPKSGATENAKGLIENNRAVLSGYEKTGLA